MLSKDAVTMGIAALSVIGAFVGIFAGVYVLPSILGHILSDYGIVQMPLIRNVAGIAAIAWLSVCSAILGSWLSSRAVNKTSPRILVTE